MGKKSGRSGDKATKATAAAFVLKVPMHCSCDGCADKIRAGVKDLALHHSIDALDQSALWTKGHLTLLSAEEPDKLRRRLRKTTGKNVALTLLPKPPQAAAAAAADVLNAAALEDLLRRLALQQQGQPGPGGWTTLHQQQQPAAAGYPPWAALQVPQPEAYLPAYPAPGGAWGAYAYPLDAAAAAQLGHGAYGGGWHGHVPY